MNVAVIGASGACGHALCVQLLQRRIVPSTHRLQLVGHRGGSSEHELWGMRADLGDAFADWAPALEVVLDPEAVEADIVVMMAGATVSSDPGATTDRAALARRNVGLFRSYAAALARRPEPPIVVVQSNPVELAVSIFAELLGPRRVLGAGAWSDTLRFTREVAADLGASPRDVLAFMLGQHGDHLVPIWSQLDVRGRSRAEVREYVDRTRAGQPLSALPGRIREGKAGLLALLGQDRFEEALAYVEAMPADLRTAVRPFFTHFTAGRTTEAATARAAADIVAAFVDGVAMVVPAQVQLVGRWGEALGFSGVLGVPALLGRREWGAVLPVQAAEDELEALHEAGRAITAANQLAG